jgi:hypothetical protein
LRSQAADGTPATKSSAEPAKGADSPQLEVQLDFLPSTSDRKIDFPDRPASIENLFNNFGTQQMPVPPPTYVPNQRSKRLLDERNNWGFISPEDIVQEYMSRQGLRLPEFGPDGRDRDTMSVMERYYDRQTHGRGMTNSIAPEDISHSLFGPQQNDLGMFTMLGTGPSTKLPGLSDRRYYPGSVRPEALSDLLGLRNNSLSSEAISEREAQEKQMEAFKKALNFQQPPTPLTTLDQGPASATAQFGWNGNASDNANPAQRNPYDPVAGTYNAALATAAPKAPVAPAAPVAPGQINPYAAPASASPARLGPPKADFTVPQRRF